MVALNFVFLIPVAADDCIPHKNFVIQVTTVKLKFVIFGRRIKTSFPYHHDSISCLILCRSHHVRIHKNARHMVFLLSTGGVA